MNENTEKIIEPKMRFDAFMANVKDGGLRSVSSIYMLVCYIVANMNKRVSAATIIEAVNDAMIANYFEISDAVNKLIKAGTINEGDDKMLYMDEQDVKEIALIEKDLPLTIRQRSIKACQKVIARESYKRENKVICEQVDGGYKVHLKVSDNTTDFMNLELFAVTDTQAELIKDKFISDPAAVYETLIDAIFNN
ncbi:MAG: DUF4364 family protein [Eubacterium coprostanoligenes]|uniref:DUF4364 domain-containing protein n=3 Tax=Eubacterium coprostanoligenes TaxID=290054 RepID=A0A1T4KUD8_9FIRM|nr:DUF4364 family protein [Eubacterium coprostanoligenes]MCI6360957.1 DUF4364 family protein [Eubacterium coprostanoligenes]MCI7264568.1 DUF4364 family protein [Eubacterium coprostanoligenes]MDD7357707.1 DUF4364 family protein [Eubacterium coprostanoligenes]MDY5376602.1 DUF4364 family protein [Eubacterium coprostanoligenes]SJZ46039.1 protein of unknown function [Eubacterium coprostanoligenes]